VNQNPKLLAAMESRDGFVPLPPAFRNGRGWPDWRGSGRHATSDDVPARLPEKPRLLWSRVMTGCGMAGLSAADGVVMVADKSADCQTDVFHCLDADSGIERWRIAYPAKGEMDFTNSPRATPVIHRDRVYLLGALGDLLCVGLDSGKVIWRKNLPRDFAAPVPTWGFCATPLVIDDKLIINPGSDEASLVALDLLTGKPRWQTAGPKPAYSSFIETSPRGIRQIIGYDAVSVGGWDPANGKRLWRMVPDDPGDFNVPTPVMLGERLLLSTENNGTRLYRFDDQGVPVETPVAVSGDLHPDTSTPVAHAGLVFGSCNGLVCLDAGTLQRNWTTDGGPLADYCSLIAGNRRLLIATQSGELLLVKATPQEFAPISKLELFPDVPDTEKDVWSHPALVGNRLYIRNSLAAYCFLLE
jgi:outer membrane protein assembly factor BamB